MVLTLLSFFVFLYIDGYTGTVRLQEGYPVQPQKLTFVLLFSLSWKGFPQTLHTGWSLA